MRAPNVPAPARSHNCPAGPSPQGADSTVLVNVKAADLNAAGISIATGVMAQMIPHAYPLVPGRDATGIVAAWRSTQASTETRAAAA